ncbi:uncharacterized protein LOC108938525 [Scleropages formosus]|uniref:uncharacterized protein LOC108938525 n=1 Tax=Scleropages formosus TaxID=113540 RepID=UPI0008780278|nr:uncharacterized protein LOC108938525 [Scleropages formosus]
MDGNAVLLALWLNLHLSFGHHHGLTLMEQAESWDVARLYCRMYFVDLAAAHTESQLGPLIEVAKAVSGKIWIGLHYSGPTGWSWVDGQVLSYNPWKKENKLGRCGTIDTRLSGDKKLLQRICMEHRPFICQGPVPPKRVDVDFVGTDCIFLKWDRPISMETVQYSFNISYSLVFQGSSASKICNSTSTSICGLSPGSEYTFSVSTVMRTADQSPPTSVGVVTRCPDITALSVLKFVIPVLAFWLLCLCYFIKKMNSKKNPKEETDSNEAIQDLISEKLEV